MCPHQLLHPGSEGRSLAPKANNSARISFAKIKEPLEVPNLLALQVESFDWLVGNEAWQARSTDDPHAHSGLAEILEEISPIEDFSGTMSLSFSAPRFDEVKASIEECKEKDLTYCAPLFVTAEFTNNTTGEIKSQTVFMGDFPMMTDKGTFIINGTERVVVSQLVRSPGVYYDTAVDKTTDKDVFSVKIIPSRGAWLEFDVDKRDTVGVRIDRKRRQPVTVLLKALGWSTEQIRERFAFAHSFFVHKWYFDEAIDFLIVRPHVECLADLATTPAASGAPGQDEMSLRFATFDGAWKQTADQALDLRVCECCPTAAAVTSEGVVAAYRNRSDEEIRDNYVARLVNGKWTTPQAVFADNWKIAACPVNGPALSANGRTVAMTWFTVKQDQGQAYLAFSTDAGATWVAINTNLNARQVYSPALQPGTGTGPARRAGGTQPA